MTISLGGWLTLIIGGIVLYGGLILCLSIALKKGRHLQSNKESDKRVYPNNA
ncbi:MAG: hypothetical protein JSV84_02565 [Gemmatimonadota bacterium]|nr:MAG: hypothetical protein JSV84_12360 [Gemmatimonadota bacterium]UCE19251.1 MAG: hypothetical protein JSV84_02565 [Gemmatimonadota bacterium]